MRAVDEAWSSSSALSSQNTSRMYGSDRCETGRRSALVIREIKRTIFENYYKNCEQMIDLEIEGHVRCFASEDCRAAVQAHLRKRKPKFEDGEAGEEAADSQPHQR